MLGIDKLSYQSRWCRVSPLRKFALYLVMLVLAFALPPVGQAALLLVIAVFTCWLLRVGPRRYLRWLAVPLGFLVMGVGTIILSVAHHPQSLLLSVPIGSFYLGIDAQGLAMANQTFWRSLAALAATYWLVLNLPFGQLIILLQRLRVPRLLIEQILLTWRFIFILLDEAQAIHRAQTLRFGYRTLPGGYRSFAMLVSMLFSRVLLRYQQMVTTLDIKLYQGDFHL
ncbi:energy-coupling factor ABC transporter transmembrane protein [Buttiauxella selenatireducens]|uniref:Energy-coupling factor ABC transporter transmembrane protein n=1 Tax=Buttiauxella selenatireducens TaxID=3073902 RepID=A0ABY9SG39_9ENTR|nr:energy-coupling factor ABC transporter transmembrane protein [Buttiauxella sp. R73]WMY75923.1 energy-coupling factor ABC transporter transmembrane protein [Buttiauxella sp. R73]